MILRLNVASMRACGATGGSEGTCHGRWPRDVLSRFARQKDPICHNLGQTLTSLVLIFDFRFSHAIQACDGPQPTMRSCAVGYVLAYESAGPHNRPVRPT